MKNKSNWIYFSIGLAIGVIAVYIILSMATTDLAKIKISNKAKPKNKLQVGIHKEVVPLTDKELKEFGIKVKEVGPGTIQLHSELTGEIIPDPTKVARIIPRFAGIVREVRKNIGDHLEKGEVIAVIESNESLVRYEVKSSIAGTIIKIHLTPGEVIVDDKHSVTVADLSSVWANLSIYQKDLLKIKVGQVSIISTIDGSRFSKSNIFYISPIVDEQTRTATARVKLNNSSGIWKPGMFITAKVATTRKTVSMVVNKNAIQIFKGQTVVFVKDKKGFRPQPVSVGFQNNKSVEILDGLHQGQNYISEGAFTIKAELLKESLGGGQEN
ncbi:MAG TPA: HlyD family efflux transporter periplasmic adaptor subunit [Ignavibacteria bacterium]|nr:HlyD family efflux transporter periplasmic adaptor subunit [Ignavibacteria bacterium]